MIRKRELGKLAALQISAVITSMDLALLFGEELYELGEDSGGEWVHEYLAEIQRKTAAKLVPKALR